MAPRENMTYCASIRKPCQQEFGDTLPVLRRQPLSPMRSAILAAKVVGDDNVNKRVKELSTYK